MKHMFSRADHVHRCLDDLDELLPKDLGELHTVSVNYGISEYDTLGLLDADTGKMLGGIGAVPRGQPGYLVRANRDHFRRYLFQNLDIQFGKIFQSYEQDANGVTVHFRDGSTAHGDILVGADGGHSHIRQQLLGKEASQLVPSQYVPIIQEMVLTRDEYLPVHNFGSSAVIAGRDGLRFLVGLLESLDGGERARYYTATCYKSDDPNAEAVWTHSATKEELYAKVLEKIEGLPEIMTNLFKRGGVDGMSSSQIKLEEFIPPPQLPKGRVTLLGDAAHTMVPFRGAGANTAVTDACNLVRLICDPARASSPEELLREYEAKMLARGVKMVLSSREGGEDLLGPLAGRINAVS